MTKYLFEKLHLREKNNSFRQLSKQNNLIDFCSNDYLGFSRSDELKKNILNRLSVYPNGSTGSRLLTGNSELAEGIEKDIAAFHNAEAGLLFNSGYDANLGLFSCIAGKDDTIIYDELCHASIRDGIRLSYANGIKFSHNDSANLIEKLKRAKGNRFVAIESVYSMDGDSAPLKEIADICQSHDAHLIVDEAHTTGVIGVNGKGLVSSLGLEDMIFARVHTFGKALGCHGSIILGSKVLRDYLINFSRPFIYSTAPSPYSLVAISESYKLLQKSQKTIDIFTKNIAYFNERIENNNMISISSPIQTIIVSGNDNVKQLSAILKDANLNVLPVLSPTVPEGKERLRICVHSFNTFEEIDLLTEILKRFLKLQ